MAGPKGHRRHVRVREKPAPRYASVAEAVGGVLLDSDIIIALLRGNDPAVTAASDALDAAEVPTYCTAVSWAEVFAGIRKGEEPLAEDFFDMRGEVVIDARAGRQAGAYLARYRRSHGMEIADALIAAAASTNGFQLWTRNKRHFPMQDLKFYEPDTAP